MFTLVHNITSALKSYEAKAVNTHTERKHRDPNYPDGLLYDSKNDGDPIDDSGDDNSVVSVKALILFLEDYIESRLASKLNPVRDNASKNDFAPWMQANYSNNNKITVSKNAANAYAQSSNISRKYSSRDEASKNLTHGELKDVYSLVQDLRQLHKNNVSYIKIDSNSRFLDSIYDAVNKRKPML